MDYPLLPTGYTADVSGKGLYGAGGDPATGSFTVTGETDFNSVGPLCASYFPPGTCVPGRHMEGVTGTITVPGNGGQCSADTVPVDATSSEIDLSIHVPQNSKSNTWVNLNAFINRNEPCRVADYSGANYDFQLGGPSVVLGGPGSVVKVTWHYGCEYIINLPWSCTPGTPVPELEP